MSGDPGNPLYPRGDSRNPARLGKGISGLNRECYCGTPIPGERFTLRACIDDEACVALYGEDGCHPIGSELYQTVGFMGGQINELLDEETRLYEVVVDGEVTGAQACDFTEYEVGQWVALAKVGTQFPTEGEGVEEHRVPVTNTNVPTVGIEEYIIVPYLFD